MATDSREHHHGSRGFLLLSSALGILCVACGTLESRVVGKYSVTVSAPNDISIKDGKAVAAINRVQLYGAEISIQSDKTVFIQTRQGTSSGTWYVSDEVVFIVFDGRRLSGVMDKNRDIIFSIIDGKTSSIKLVLKRK